MSHAMSHVMRDLTSLRQMLRLSGGQVNLSELIFMMKEGGMIDSQLPLVVLADVFNKVASFIHPTYILLTSYLHPTLQGKPPHHPTAKNRAFYIPSTT